MTQKLGAPMTNKPAFERPPGMTNINETCIICDNAPDKTEVYDSMLWDPLSDVWLPIHLCDKCLRYLQIQTEMKQVTETSLWAQKILVARAEQAEQELKRIREVQA